MSNSEEPSLSAQDNKDEIDLSELFIQIWKAKYFIGSFTLVTAVVSVAIALSLPNVYRAEALLAVRAEGGGALSSLASQYGGIASLAGISLPSSGGSNEKAIGIETIQSRQFISGFIERHGLLPDLMAPKEYDWSSNELTYDEKIYDADSDVWNRKAVSPRQSQPSLQEAYDEFSTIMTLSEDIDGGFITLAIEHRSPYVAQKWVAWLIDDINAKMVSEATTESQQAIDYLTTQLQVTSIVALQEVFYSLIEEQTKTAMLAKVNREYLFKTIDPAVVPEERVRPNRALIAIFGTLFGGLLSMVAVVLAQKFRHESPS